VRVRQHAAIRYRSLVATVNFNCIRRRIQLS
jgi:hypothetical protein